MRALRSAARGYGVSLHSAKAINVRNECRFSQKAFSSTDSSVPRIVSSSIWQAIVPKAFRRPNDPVAIAERRRAQVAKNSKPKEWNPATFFIFIALLIGSNAIQMIALKNSRRNYSRKAEAKIALLREVIERMQKGEDVDVKAMLGTGDPRHEKEWEEVMRELASDEGGWDSKRRKRVEYGQGKVEQKAPEGLSTRHETAPAQTESEHMKNSARRPGFY